MKKMAVFLSILFLASASFAQSILIGKKYTGFECKKILKKMVPIYQINIKDRNIIFYSNTRNIFLIRIDIVNLMHRGSLSIRKIP